LKGYHIVLSSGDIDFVPALQMARKDDENIRVTLLTYNFGFHEALSKLSSEHLFFEEHPEMIRQ
jgi:uncharacterized LabA/DUF88 family protein